MLDTLQATAGAGRLTRRDIPILGACLELGAGTARHADGAAGAAHRRARPRARRPRPPRQRPRHAPRGRAGRRWRWRRRRPSAAATSPRSPAGPARLHDHAYGMAAEGGGAGLPRRRPFDLDGHDQRRRPRLRRGAGASWSSSGSTPTPTTTRRRRRRRATCTAWRSPSSPASRAWRRSSASRPFASGAAGEHPRLRRPLDRPGREARLARRTASTSSTCAQIDERGVSALLAERIARLAGARRPPARQLRRRLPRPGGRARHRHGGAGRRHLPRGASGHGDALRQRPRRLGRRGRAQPLPRRARPHRASPPPSWSRASSAAPCSTASPAPSPPADDDRRNRHARFRRPDRPRDPPRRRTTTSRSTWC